MAKVDNFDYTGEFAILKMYTASSGTTEYQSSGSDSFLIIGCKTTENHRCILYNSPDDDKTYLLGDPEGGYTITGISRVIMSKVISYEAEDPRDFTWGYVQDNKSYVSSGISEANELYSEVFKNINDYVYEYGDIINATRPFYKTLQPEETRNTDPNKYSNLFRGNTWVRQYTSSTAMHEYQATLLNPDYANLVANQTTGGMPFMSIEAVVLGKGILLSSDYEACRKYIDDGTIPDDALYMSEDDDGDPDEGTNGQDDSYFPNSDLTPPAATTLTSSPNNFYIIPSQNVQTFFDEFWDFDWGEFILNSITGLYGNLKEAVIFLKLFPFSGDKLNASGESERVKLARTTMETVYETISKSASPAILTAGTVHIDYRGTKRTFKDFSPYTGLQLYLPLYGYIDLDVNIFMGRDLTVKYSIDVNAGILTYYICCKGFLTNLISCQCGFDLPYSLSYGNEVMSAVMNNVVNFTVGMAEGAITKSPAGMVDTVLQGAPNQVNNLNCRGAAENNGWLYADPKCHIIYKRPNSNRPNNYGEKIGFPLYQQRKLGNLSGFTKCINASMKFSTHYPTSEEYEEIKNLLEGGIYL